MEVLCVIKEAESDKKTVSIARGPTLILITVGPLYI